MSMPLLGVCSSKISLLRKRETLKVILRPNFSWLCATLKSDGLDSAGKLLDQERKVTLRRFFLVLEALRAGWGGKKKNREGCNKTIPRECAYFSNFQTFKLFKLSNFQIFKLFKLSNFQTFLPGQFQTFKLSYRQIQTLKLSNFEKVLRPVWGARFKL